MLLVVTLNILFTFHVEFFLIMSVYLFFFSVALCLTYYSSNLEKRVFSVLETVMHMDLLSNCVFGSFLFPEAFHRFLVCCWV